MKSKITKRLLDSLEPGEKDYWIYDEDLKGFAVRVTPKGKRAFYVQYRMGGADTPRKRIQIGVYGKMTPDKARLKAKGLFGDISRGNDPLDKRQMLREDITLSKLCDVYLEDGCTRKKPSTIATDKGRIKRHIKPLLGKRRLKTIHSGDIEKFLVDVAQGKTAAKIKTKKHGVAKVTGGKGTATRTLGLLGGIFTFAVTRKYIKENPVHGIKRFKDKKFERYLSDKEFNQLGKALQRASIEGHNPQALAIIRLLILTGCRKSEIETLKWKYIDFDNGYLRLPESKTDEKNVPIGKSALELLSGLSKTKESEFLFPSSTNLKKSYQGTPKVWRQIRKMAKLEDVRLHDLRHSFASVGAGGGDSLLVIGGLLGHVDAKTTKRYAHLADDPLKNAADRISLKIENAMSGKEKTGA